MRTNATLQTEIRTDKGVNAHGEAIGDAVEWSRPVRCLITANSDTRLGKYEDGEFRQSSYTILVEGDRFEGERIRLASASGEPLGEFRVSSVAVTSVGRVRIIV